MLACLFVRWFVRLFVYSFGFSSVLSGLRGKWINEGRKGRDDEAVGLYSVTRGGMDADVSCMRWSQLLAGVAGRWSRC